MKRISLLFCLILQTSLVSFAQNAKQFPFRDESLPVNDRIEDLLGRLTLEQKISLIGGMRLFMVLHEKGWLRFFRRR